MIRLLVLSLALAATPLQAATPSVAFDGDAYDLAVVERDAAGLRNLFLREGETRDRFSRLLRISDLPAKPAALDLARSAAAMARLRAPGLGAETFAPEGREGSDITLTWLQLADENDALEFHVVRYSDQAAGVREYALILREYLNGRPPAAALEGFAAFVVSRQGAWIEAVGALERSPVARD